MSSLAFTILNSGSGGWGRDLLGGLSIFLITPRGVMDFIFSLKEGQEVLFSLMANLASPPPGINNECSLSQKLFYIPFQDISKKSRIF